MYQKLYSLSELKAELADNGFKILKIEASIKHFWLETLISKIFYYVGCKAIGIKIIRSIEKTGAQPFSWTVLCERK